MTRVTYHGQTIAFWWIVFVLFITGGTIWFLGWAFAPCWIVTAFKILHIAAGVGLTVDLIMQLRREGALREIIWGRARGSAAKGGRGKL